jgi:hypothetical protein
MLAILRLLARVPSGGVQRVPHSVHRARVIQYRWRIEQDFNVGGDALLRPWYAIQLEGAVHPTDPLVIPRVPQIARPVPAHSEAPAMPLRQERGQRRAMKAHPRRSSALGAVVRDPRELSDLTCRVH